MRTRVAARHPLSHALAAHEASRRGNHSRREDRLGPGGTGGASSSNARCSEEGSQPNAEA